MSRVLFTCFSVALLITGCGGGGGGSSVESTGPVTSSLTFDVGTAYSALRASGQSGSFSVSSSNNCKGSGTFTAGPANTNTTFEGQPALSSTSVLNINYTNCTPATISNTAISYTDTNYVPLGALGDYYVVYSGAYSVPSSVRVGDVGILANAIRYTDNTKTTQNGTTQESYVVEADTATTALITIATKVYSSPSVLESTSLTTYRINDSNVMTLVSITIQYSNGVNVVLTRT
jgi:hypothetical protein